MGNILQNSLDVTYEDFLKGVFGMKPKPVYRDTINETTIKVVENRV